MLVGARLYAVPLRVPRTFYVNSTRAPEEADSPAQTLGGRRVQRTLPFGRDAFHLYQVSDPCSEPQQEDSSLRIQTSCTSTVSRNAWLCRNAWPCRTPLRDSDSLQLRYHIAVSSSQAALIYRLRGIFYGRYR